MFIHPNSIFKVRIQNSTILEYVSSKHQMYSAGIVFCTQTPISQTKLTLVNLYGEYVFTYVWSIGFFILTSFKGLYLLLCFITQSGSDVVIPFFPRQKNEQYFIAVPDKLPFSLIWTK